MNIKRLVKDTVEETITVRDITVTFSFTDEDLKDPDTREFYESIKPNEVQAPEDDEQITYE